MKKPNILYIHSHDTGRYIQPYGHAVSTPNLQRLAEDGVVFRQAFSAAPTCSPSRAALLTGQASHSCGVLGLAHDYCFGISDLGHHLVQTLRDKAGYHCAISGQEHVVGNAGKVGEHATEIGYHQTLSFEDTPSTYFGHDTSEEMREIELSAAAFLDSAPPQPFFLDVGFWETHRQVTTDLYSTGHFGQQGMKEGDSRYCSPLAPLPDLPEIRQDVADFNSSVERLDHKIGVVLEALERNNFVDNTLVICTTDHGPPFPKMKANLTDHGIGVFLIMRGPEGFSGGKVVDSLVSQIDIYPTLCDLLELERPSWLQGVSLLPLVKGETDKIRDDIFAEQTYHLTYDAQRAVRTKRWKYIRRLHRRTANPITFNSEPSLSKSKLVNYGWSKEKTAAEQLYDTYLDPNEANNLANDPEHTAVLEDMRARLYQRMKESGDPLLSFAKPD